MNMSREELDRAGRVGHAMLILELTYLGCFMFGLLVGLIAKALGVGPDPAVSMGLVGGLLALVGVSYWHACRQEMKRQ